MENETPSDRGRGGRGLLGWTAATTFAAWLLVTASNHHPSSLFDRTRRYDRTSMFIPNWRFFAPNPAQHDFQVVHRVLTADGTQTPWQQTTRNPPRSWQRTIWAPDRRREKAIFDICSELLMAKGAGVRDVSGTSAYRVLRDFVEGSVRREFTGRDLPQGFQFLIARSAGHDHGEDPTYLLVSEFQPLTAKVPE
jgi:hypothetical protein